MLSLDQFTIQANVTVPLQLPLPGQGKCFKVNRPNVFSPGTLASPCQSIDAYFKAITGSALDVTLQPQTNAIASWYRASASSDSTNGHSWCSGNGATIRYKNSSPGFAPSLAWMLATARGDSNLAKKMFCGAEAKVSRVDASGQVVIEKLMYIIDAFDDKWVLFPGSLDIMKDAWSSLRGYSTESKTDVFPVRWTLTGKRNILYHPGSGFSGDSC